MAKPYSVHCRKVCDFYFEMIQNCSNDLKIDLKRHETLHVIPNTTGSKCINYDIQELSKSFEYML